MPKKIAHNGVIVFKISSKYYNCREDLMKEIDKLRRHELYPHPPEDCSPSCQQRGVHISFLFSPSLLS